MAQLRADVGGGRLLKRRMRMAVEMKERKGVQVAVKVKAKQAKAEGRAVTWRGMADKAGAAEPVEVLRASAMGKVLRMREVAGEQGATMAMGERPQEHAIRTSRGRARGMRKLQHSPRKKSLTSEAMLKFLGANCTFRPRKLWKLPCALRSRRSHSRSRTAAAVQLHAACSSYDAKPAAAAARTASRPTEQVESSLLLRFFFFFSRHFCLVKPSETTASDKRKKLLLLNMQVLVLAMFL